MKVYEGLPPKGRRTTLIGWTEDYRPFVLQWTVDNSGEECWKAMGLDEYGRGVAHAVYPGGNKPTDKLIKYWAYSPMGPDPNQFNREMLSEEYLNSVPDVPATDPGLLQRLKTAITRFK